MKRLLILAAMFLCCISTTFAQFSGSGSGTENDPYLILNPIHLNQMRNFLNANACFKLMADIDLTEFINEEYSSQGWLPIGNDSAPFNGKLDGNGKTISGLIINRSEMNDVGLFGFTNKCYISDLTLKVSIKGNKYVGGFIGRAGCSSSGSQNEVFNNIERCTLVGDIIGNEYVGGIAGMVTGEYQYQKYVNTKWYTIREYNTIYFLDSHAIVNIKGNDKIGGIIGGLGQDNNAKIIGCTLEQSDISGQNHVGGVIGYGNCDIDKCSYIGNITGSSYVGGLCGNASESGVGSGSYANITNSYVLAQIKAIGECVGGLVGKSQHTSSITNSYYDGNISGKDKVGGLVGYSQNGWNWAKISLCLSNATVKGENQIGGLVGYLDGDIESCISYCTTISATVDNAGRVYGEKKDGSVGAMGTTKENKAFNKTIVTKAGVAQDVQDNIQNGAGVSTTTLKLKATYDAMGFDFSNIWEIQETESLPYFKTQTAPPAITSQVVSGATTISGKCVDGGTITLEFDGVKQQMVSKNHEFSFTVSPLQAGHEVRVSAKADDKEQSYFTTAVVSFLGKGTEADPYQISTAADLTQVYRKGYYRLMNDIDLTSYINQFSPTEGWQSIGRDGSETIHFDGNGKKITGLWCNSTRDNTGLFSCFANGEIKNLTVETATGKQVKGGANTGIIIGKMINGMITNCRVKGAVSDGTPVGGIVGLLDGGKISLCQASVTINTAGEKTYIGGVAGETSSGEIDQCFTEGTLTATGAESYVGGLVGKNYATVTNSYSNATVTSSYNAAGLIAYNYGLVEKCYATGNIFSSNYGAGVIGYNDGENAIIRNCAAMNNKIDVTYESQQQQQGGGYGQRIIGGIKNSAPAPDLNNYALKTMQVSLNNMAQKVSDDIMNGVGKNGSDLLKASTYQELGWDFTNTWTIKEDENYPSLKNNDGTVVKPGEDPNPDPEPEPTETDDDKIVVAGVSATKGQQVAFSIDLENKTTDLTAYQFDLTLPDGISLSVNDKGKFVVTKTSRYEDDSQTLNITKLEGSSNTYRFVCFSMSNEKITGTSGAILNAALTIGASVNDGSHEAAITSIVVTKVNGTQLKLKDAKFSIVVTSVIKGDANGDGEVNVSDIVEIVNYIMNKPSDKFVFAAADLNGDGEVNVTDIVKVVSIIMSSGSNAPKRASVAEMVDNDQLTLAVNDKSLSLCLDNEAQYVASQFEIRLGDGQTLESISLNNKRSGGHLLSYAKTGDNLYKVVVYSTDNRPFNGNSGELLSFKVYGTGNVEVSDILFVTSGEMEKLFPALAAGTTGIDVIKTSDAMDIYSVDGRLIQKQATNTNGLKKGLYIINGKKLIVK